MTNIETYEVKIYTGCREGYDGVRFNRDYLIKRVGDFQKSCDVSIASSVRITDTTFVYRDYIEDGWEIAAICYPRFPKDKQNILTFATRLGEFLLKELKQNRISVVAPDKTYLLEN